MRIELEHFKIDGRYGGSQQWMLDPWMRLGGCGALAAVDSCIFLAKHKRIKKLVNDVNKVDRKRYHRLAMDMKPYLSPRAGGIDRLDIYVDGFGRYLKDIKNDAFTMEEYKMGGSRDDAWKVFKAQIDQGILVPVLHLKPIDKEWKEFTWHWFLLNGYEEADDHADRLVKAVTYGAYEWHHWNTFWDEEHADNGGMILYHLN